jgi:glycosyltransferase involved in cell wall biosynthesis
MKICVIGLRGLPDIPGGIETHCENLYGEIAELRPDLKIVVYGRRPYIGSDRYVTDTGVEVVPAAALNNKYLETLSNTLVAILRARFGEQADCVHLHAIGPGLLAPLARLLGMRVILTHHGDDFQRAKWNRFARAVLRFGERVGVTSATHTIAVSRNLAARLRSSYPRKAETIQYIPNGADHIVDQTVLDGSAATLQEFGLESGKYILAVGRLVPEKGFADLIKAHKQSGSALPLVIAGGASNSDHDRELADMAHAEVCLTGSLPRANVAQLLAHTKLFVMPSHHEGLPIAALEAWAMTAPLLLSDIQPNKDLGLPEAHYFKVGDIDALADRLKPDSPDLPSLPLPAAFIWSTIARQTVSVYDSFQRRFLLKSATS